MVDVTNNGFADEIVNQLSLIVDVAQSLKFVGVTQPLLLQGQWSTTFCPMASALA